MNKKLYFLIILSLGLGQGCYCDLGDVETEESVEVVEEEEPTSEEWQTEEPVEEEPVEEELVEEEPVEEEPVDWDKTLEPEAPKVFPKNLISYWDSEQGLLINQWLGEFGNLDGSIEENKIKYPADRVRGSAKKHSDYDDVPSGQS